MDGFKTHGQLEGTWSDDTSLTLATMDSLKYGLDYENMMSKFSDWYFNDQYTPHGECFDIGNTTRESIERYEAGVTAVYCGGTSERDNGNGSLMRILPASLYVMNNIVGTDSKVDVINKISSLTHQHIRSQIACNIYTFIVHEIIKNDQDMLLRDIISKGIDKAYNYYRKQDNYMEELMYFKRIFNKKIFNVNEERVHSSGYVLYTLEASIWCLVNTDTYKESILKAVNLGNDTDTTGAVTGGLSGLYYGYDNMPSQWIEKTVRRDYLINSCENFYNYIK